MRTHAGMAILEARLRAEWACGVLRHGARSLARTKHERNRALQLVQEVCVCVCVRACVSTQFTGFTGANVQILTLTRASGWFVLLPLGGFCMLTCADVC